MTEVKYGYCLYGDHVWKVVSVQVLSEARNFEKLYTLEREDEMGQTLCVPHVLEYFITSLDDLFEETA